MIFAVDHQSDVGVLRNDCFERKPPQFADTIGKAGRNVDRKRSIMPLEDRISIRQRVAISVINCYADKPPPKIPLCQALMHFVKADDFNAGAPEKPQDALQEVGRYFQEPVWLEPLRP